MADADAFRNAMALLAGAVNIITTDGPSGLAGFTATAVCSVTDQPPTLLVCMNRSSFAHRFFEGNNVLCVNVLGAANKEAPALFADRNVQMEDRFARVQWSRLATGSPLIDGAVVSFDCRIKNTSVVGSHSIFLCEVQDIRRGEAQGGLVYFNRDYHPVGFGEPPVPPARKN
ncbi:flavin reductase [Castellaniella defragrans]|nr:flavin reductase [Castellaniella defragrans]KAB0602864.1 flavin reductase [Castellaniella defragrans]MBB6082705.1 flavin reductase [Castellaniella defragrans]